MEGCFIPMMRDSSSRREDGAVAVNAITAVPEGEILLSSPIRNRDSRKVLNI